MAVRSARSFSFDFAEREDLAVSRKHCCAQGPGLHWISAHDYENRLGARIRVISRYAQHLRPVSPARSRRAARMKMPLPKVICLPVLPEAIQPILEVTDGSIERRTSLF
jgi:hypothetical protein